MNSIPTRTRLVNNRFYGHPAIDYPYGPLSPTSMVVPNVKRSLTHEEDGDGAGGGGGGEDSPVYSTTTDVMSESGSFLVPSSSKRNGPPLPAPRYFTLGPLRSQIENLEKTPLPKPRSRSNSRTRLNNPTSDNASLLYDERPVSSSDSGIGPSELTGLSNGDAARASLPRSRPDASHKHYTNPSALAQQARYQTLTSPSVRGTEC